MSRKRSSSIDISLFPFLSVLCALIGVLTLFLLLTLSARVLESAEASPPATPAPLTPAGSEPDGLSENDYQQVRRQLDELTATLMARRKELDELEQMQAELLELLAEKQALLKGENTEGMVRGIELEPSEDVQLVPDPQFAVKKRPRFLELKAFEFVLQPEGRQFPAKDLRQADSPLQQYFADLDRHRQTEYLLLLIHPDGAEAFRDVREYMHEEFPSADSELPSRIDVGYEPYSAGWILISQEFKPIPEKP